MKLALLTDTDYPHSSVEMAHSPRSPVLTEKQKAPTRPYRASSAEKRALKEKRNSEVNKRDALIGSKALYVLPIFTILGTLACIASAPIGICKYKKTAEALVMTSLPLMASPLIATCARTAIAYQRYGGSVAWATARDAFAHIGHPEGVLVNTAFAMLAFTVGGSFFV